MGWTRLQNGQWKSENSTRVTGASAAPRTGAPSSGHLDADDRGRLQAVHDYGLRPERLDEPRALRGELLLLQVVADLRAESCFVPAQARLVRLIERLDLLLGDESDLGRHLGVEERRDRHPPLRRLLGQQPLGDQGIELLPLQIVDLLLELAEPRAERPLEVLGGDGFPVDLRERLGRQGPASYARTLQASATRIKVSSEEGRAAAGPRETCEGRSASIHVRYPIRAIMEPQASLQCRLTPGQCRTGLPIPVRSDRSRQYLTSMKQSP